VWNVWETERGSREKEETKIHREQDKADRSRHDIKITSVERERER